MTTATPLAGSVQTMTITLASLATSAAFTVGRESTAIDQKDVDDAIDVMIGGLITVGTTPTINTSIQIWSYGSFDDTNFTAGATGSDAGLTPSYTGLMRLLEVIPVLATTSNVGYKWGPRSLAQAWGGIIPVQWGIFVTHNTGVNLNSTGGNHLIKYFAFKFESS